MIAIGLDPGVGGGIAALTDTGAVLLAVKMPQTEQDVYDLLSQVRTIGSPAPVLQIDEDRRAVIERVSASPQMGVVSAFTFGKGYGGLLMALTAAKIPFDQVTPQRWQAAMQCRTQGDKNVSKRRAQQLFPRITVTHATADALLLAEYCRRFHQGLMHGQESSQATGKERRVKDPPAGKRTSCGPIWPAREGERPA